MSAEQLTLRARAAAERLMVDTCRIRPITGETTDTTTGVVTPTYGAPVYEGACKIQNQRPWPSNPDAGEHQWTVAPTDLHLPVSRSAAVGVGHMVEITASFNPDNVGRRFRIRADDRKTFQSAVRFLVEEVTN